MRIELRALTGIRAFAALGVVLFHLIVQYPYIFRGDSSIVRALQFGSNGVDLFFILSGFIIAYSYAGEFRTFSWAKYGQFLHKRLARIWPAHMFALSLLAALGVLLTLTGRNFLHDSPIADFISQALMINNWNPWHVSHTWNGPDWSISAEWSAYLLFPLLLAAVRWVPRRLLPILIVLLPLLMVMSYRFGQADFGPVRIMTEFPCGIALYYLWRHVQPSSLWSRVGLACALLYVPLGVVLGLVGADVRWQVLLVPPLLFSIALNAGPVARLLARPLPEYLGRISYSLYITHYVVIISMRFLIMMPRIERSVPLTLALTVIEIVIIYLLARFTYHYIEEPARKWLTRDIQKTRTQTA